jgi:hypothetical protein
VTDEAKIAAAVSWLGWTIAEVLTAADEPVNE